MPWKWHPCECAWFIQIKNIVSTIGSNLYILWWFKFKWLMKTFLHTFVPTVYFWTLKLISNNKISLNKNFLCQNKSFSRICSLFRVISKGWFPLVRLWCVSIVLTQKNRMFNNQSECSRRTHHVCIWRPVLRTLHFNFEVQSRGTGNRSSCRNKHFRFIFKIKLYFIF